MYMNSTISFPGGSSDNGSEIHQLNLHFTFSITQVQEILDKDRTIKIPMYLAVEWKVAYRALYGVTFEFNST